MTNAFASSNWQALRAANETLLEEEDQILGAQRFEEATVELETADGKGLALKTKVGGLIGDPWAVYSFCQPSFAMADVTKKKRYILRRPLCEGPRLRNDGRPKPYKICRRPR